MMVEIELKGYAIRNIEFINRISKSETIEIGTQVNTKVNYNDETSECIGEFTVVCKNAGDEDKFKIAITIEAIYLFPPEESKKDIHLRICEELFVQTRATICSVCGVAGLPPILIPKPEFTVEEMEFAEQEKNRST